jgi:hypothetical protein
MTVAIRFDRQKFMETINLIEGRMQQTVIDVAATTHTLAKRNANEHVRTGTNKKSITMEFRRGVAAIEPSAQNEIPVASDAGSVAPLDGFKKGDVGFRIYTQSGYGAYIELGTQSMLARPYIAPAFNEALERIQRHLTRLL